MKPEEKNAARADVALTRRKMLMRLGLAATAIYAAPALLQLSEAKASSFSGPSGGRRIIRRRVRRAASFSGPNRRRIVRRPLRANRRRRIGSFSFSGPSFSR